jgi:hypothetical protein
MTGTTIPHNAEHLEAWLHDLETTDAPQGTGVLYRENAAKDASIGYCCLGRGCRVMGLPSTLTNDDEENFGDTIAVFGHDGYTALAPPEFIEWLGIDLTAEPTSEGYDIALDVPAHLVSRNDSLGEVAHCSSLNDGILRLDHAGRCTFAQIADMIRYFGIAGVR